MPVFVTTKRRFITAATACAVLVYALALCLAPERLQAQPLGASRPDVLVVGGTPAGVAAAIAAARRHENVTLVAAGDGLGDLLSDGLMNQWDLNVASDGTLVQRGIFSEIYRLLPSGFEPSAASRALAQLVAREPRITVLYHQSPSGISPSTWPDGRHIDAVMFKSMRSNRMISIRAPLIIDATDSADIAAMAGARYDIGRQDTGKDERTQAVTEIFTVEGVDWSPILRYDAARYGPGGSSSSSAWGYATLMHGYHPTEPNAVVRDLNLARRPNGTVTINAVNLVGIDGLSAEQVFQAKRNATVEAPRLVAFLKKHLPGFEQAQLGTYAPSVYVRETRHIDGLERLTATDVWESRIPADSIGLASYPLDVHPVEQTDQPAFASTRHVYGVPFGAMVPKGLDNILVASPSISATHEAAGSARIVATTILEGEAAGAAAALANRTHTNFLQIAVNRDRIEALRRDLSDRGALVSLPPKRRTEPRTR